MARRCWSGERAQSESLKRDLKTTNQKSVLLCLRHIAGFRLSDRKIGILYGTFNSHIWAAQLPENAQDILSYTLVDPSPYSSPFGYPRKRRQITLKREMPAQDSCGSPDPKASAKANTKGGPVHWEKRLKWVKYIKVKKKIKSNKSYIFITLIFNSLVSL